ncbi:MAG: KDP operon transcriptional regulatory protein KdpE [bacterium ADurb.Bin429]|nr:MAG: KDP operon transcriptional regulatory protein KdpE [bacterium ADurb.Bin429]
MTASGIEATILVVDDEVQIRRALHSLLTARRYGVLLAENGEQALELAADHTPDLVILDLSMPGMNGLEVCRELRAWYRGPILILSVRGGEQDKIAALDLGADDYLTKPFPTGELLARIRALLRRAAQHETPPPVIHLGALEIDLARRLVTRTGQPVSLTPIEYAILAYLARNANCVVTSSQLIEQVWGNNAAEDTQALRVHVSHLRKKIEPYPTVPQYLLTEPGVGFRLKVSELPTTS